jgi:hypothetical protein
LFHRLQEPVLCRLLTDLDCDAQLMVRGIDLSRDTLLPQ